MLSTCLALLCCAAMAAADMVTDCRITMAMPSTPGANTFSTSIECSGDVELAVVAPYTIDLDHVVTYTWNGGLGVRAAVASLAVFGACMHAFQYRLGASMPAVCQHIPAHANVHPSMYCTINTPST